MNTGYTLNAWCSQESHKVDVCVSVCVCEGICEDVSTVKIHDLIDIFNTCPVILLCVQFKSSRINNVVSALTNRQNAQ